MTELLQNFKRGARQEEAEDALKNCLQTCNIPLNSSKKYDPNAVKLLLGLPEDEVQWLQRQVPRLVFVDKHVTASLEYLLTINDPKYFVYLQGQERFRELLSTKDDYLSQAPLEAAYNWSLSCMSAMQGALMLWDMEVFLIKCEKLLPGRLFQGHDNTTYDRTFAAVKHNVIYYAAEQDGYPTHPLTDMFFRTEEELVLLDITGGSDRVVKEKAETLSKWIKQEQPKVTGLILHGVVLVPLATSKIKAKYVHVLSGADAKEHMGGLRQVFR